MQNRVGCTMSAVHDVRWKSSLPPRAARYFLHAIIHYVRTEFNLSNNSCLCSGILAAANLPYEIAVDLRTLVPEGGYARPRSRDGSVQPCERCFIRRNREFLYRRREKNSRNLAWETSKVRKNAAGRILVPRMPEWLVSIISTVWQVRDGFAGHSINLRNFKYAPFAEECNVW